MNKILRHTNLLTAIILALLFASAQSIMAQKRKVMNRPYIDQRPFHYGLLIGTHMQDMEFKQNGYVDEEGNQWSVEAPNWEPGFTVGILGELRLSNHLALRLVPAMHFGTKNLKFRNTKNAEVQYQSVRSTYISVPLDLKFSAERFNNYRPYAMVGINPMLDLTVKQQQQLLFNKFDLYLEVGFGCDFYCPWFKLIPELKFSFGLLNMLNKKRTDISDPTRLIFTNSLDRVRSNMIVLTFYLE